MTDRVALIVHSSPAARRVLSDALIMFSPGYHVATARDLSSATEWLTAAHPDLVVIDGRAFGSASLAEWVVSNRLDPAKTLIIGEETPTPELLGAAIVDDPVHLPDLLAAVRDLTAATGDTGPGAQRSMDSRASSEMETNHR